jgi:hypothetical protein
MNEDWNREPQIDAIKHAGPGDWFITKCPWSMTAQERNSLFEALDTLLQEQKLPTSYGLSRLAHADEFMLMQVSDDGSVGFKHIASRNYVFLVPHSTHEKYDLYVPISNEPFMRGQFDE